MHLTVKPTIFFIGSNHSKLISFYFHISIVYFKNKYIGCQKIDNINHNIILDISLGITKINSLVFNK